jgi:hypothetical protein
MAITSKSRALEWQLLAYVTASRAIYYVLDRCFCVYSTWPIDK